ncbi:hypothetical protein K439DRAFT_1625262 [Ramaria rubella]|nr:hypothetical protein K439DRAFT_1625262 [Ramaria rubella]
MPGNNSVNVMTSHSLPSAFGDEWPQEPVDLLSHDPLLPKFYQYDHHPLWPYGKAYVYEVDTSPKAQQALSDHVKVRKIVGRFEDDLKQQGELQLLPYKAVFARKKDNQDPCDDVIQLWVADGRLYDSISPTFRDERQHGSPRKNSEGKIIGGFHFERSLHRSRPVRDDGSRGYQYQGLSMEKPRAVSSVNANSKLPDDKDRQLRNRMLKTYAAIGVAAMKLALESVQHAAHLKAELVNSLLTAQDDNFYHCGSQINMSQAQMYDGPLTITDLGPSGDRHNDNNDEESGYSNASVHSHLPVDYHPGLFMFYELGVFIRLERNVNFCFSGLRYHGGTPPTAPLGVIPPAWNTQSLAALPGGSILYVNPEMQEHCIPTKEYRLWSTRATYVTDGSDLMSHKGDSCCGYVNTHSNMSVEQKKEYAEAWDIVDQHAVSTWIFIPHVAWHKKAHKRDKTFLHLAHQKGSSFKDGFHRPKNHQGFNDDSDYEYRRPDEEEE